MTEWIVTSSVLIAAIAALRCLLRGRISLRLQYALWAVVLLRLLLPVQLGHSSLSVLNAVETSTLTQHTEIDITQIPQPSAPVPTPGTVTQPDGNLTQPSAPVSPAMVLRAVWIAGMAVTAAWFLFANLHFARMLRRSRQTDQTCGNLVVYVSPLVETPCLFGFFRPAVYVTAEVLRDERVLRHALLHEETHYLHGDHIWAVLRSVCLALHWYNPLVWLAAALSRRDAELACDEGTLHRLGEDERTAYGETLIRLTCGRKKGELLLTATTMTGSKTGLRERITLIAHKPKMAIYTLVAALLVVAVAAGCTFTGRKEDAKPQELAFSYEGNEHIGAQVLSAVRTYTGAHAAILNDLTEDDGFVSEVIISSITSVKTVDPENALSLYEVVYYLTCNDPAAAASLQERAESREFAEKWQEEGTNGDVPVLENPIHCTFRGEVIAPYTPGSQTPADASASVGILKHLSAKYQLEAVLDRLQNLQPEELERTFSGLNAAETVSWLRRAAQHRTERTEDLASAHWSLSAYLPANPSKGEVQEIISISADPTEENILKVGYRSKDMVSVTFYAEDSALYWLVRNAHSTEEILDASAMAPYRTMLEAEAQKWVDISQNWHGAQPLSSYEIISFQQIDAFRQDGADYTVYHWDAAFLSEDPLNAGWAGGMWLDSQCRIRGLIKTPYLLVRTANGKTDSLLGADDIPWAENRDIVVDAFRNP